jgi:hypothetical protein
MGVEYVTNYEQEYDDVVIDTDRPLRLSADAVRGLVKATGRTMSELLDDDTDEANRLQVMAFAELHRRLARLGHLPDAGELWEKAALVPVDFSVPTAPDPLDAESSRTSPPSAVTGE